MASNDVVRGEFYFNVSTGEVEEGKVSTWVDRMGPYPTRSEAAHALENAGARTAVWDGDDEAWSRGRRTRTSGSTPRRLAGTRRTFSGERSPPTDVSSAPGRAPTAGRTAPVRGTHPT